RTATVGGRVRSASAASRGVHRPGMSLLDVLEVAPANRTALAGAADRLAELVEPPLYPSWEEELRGKARVWRLELWRLARGPVDEPAADATDEAVELAAEDEGELERWLATAPDDAVSLALVGLVRSGVHVGGSDLGAYFWARPHSRDPAAGAAGAMTGYDEGRALPASAV